MVDDAFLQLRVSAGTRPRLIKCCRQTAVNPMLTCSMTSFREPTRQKRWRTSHYSCTEDGRCPISTCESDICLVLVEGPTITCPMPWYRHQVRRAFDSPARQQKPTSTHGHAGLPHYRTSPIARWLRMSISGIVQACCDIRPMYSYRIGAIGRHRVAFSRWHWQVAT